MFPIAPCFYTISLYPKFYLVTYKRSPKEEITTMELFFGTVKGFDFYFATAQSIMPITKIIN
jgi:hypothetical protein